MPSIVDNVTVASGAHTQRYIPASFIAGSMSVLNPNDGICYVARDRDCLSTTVGAWDWKIPSQSYAYLPGPFRSIGLYYLDRSGASLPGDISTYASTAKLDLPVFHAIGRAQVSNVTMLDIGQGTQPQPPAAGNIRLWADASGNLHHLTSQNVDRTQIDNVNAPTYINPLIGAYTLGGDLAGTVASGHVNLANASPIQARDTGGITRNLVLMDTSNNVLFYNAGAALTYWLNQNATLALMYLDNVGNLQVAANLALGGGSMLQYGNTSPTRTDYLNFGANGSLANAQNSLWTWRRNYDNVPLINVNGAGAMQLLYGPLYVGTNTSVTQLINLPNSNGIGIRNAANNADLVIGANNGNQLVLNGGWLTAGTAGALAGYLYGVINGTSVKIPYYLP